VVKKKKDDTTEEQPIIPEIVDQAESPAAQPGETAEGAATPDQQALDKLESALQASQDEARRNYDLYLRATADLENYRKRAQREKEDLSRYGHEKVLREILPIADNLERAIEHAKKDETDSQGLLQGVEMTLGQFSQVLDKFSVRPVTALGEPFDPSRHEAMGQIESDAQPPNTVVQELQKGYFLNDRLLRPALVMVAKAPPAAQPGIDETS